MVSVSSQGTTADGLLRMIGLAWKIRSATLIASCSWVQPVSLSECANSR